MASKALSGGEALEKKLAELTTKVSKASTVRVGFLEGSTEADGTPVPTIAAWQEFGTKSIPMRPFFRTMIAEHSGEWGDVLAGALKYNGYDAENALEQIGLYIGEELQQSIIDVSEPALSPITLMLRKMRSEGGPNYVVTGRTVAEAAARVASGEDVGDVSTKPLVDTATMLKSVAYQVDDGAKEFVDPDKAAS